MQGKKLQHVWKIEFCQQFLHKYILMEDVHTDGSEVELDATSKKFAFVCSAAVLTWTLHSPMLMPSSQQSMRRAS